MKGKENYPEIEDQYTQFFKGNRGALPSDSLNMEQPYAGRIVQTVTTYSVSEKPEPIEQS